MIAVLFFSWLLSVKSFVLDWASPSRESQSSAAPNILMIVVDDLGYDDTGTYTIETVSVPEPVTIDIKPGKTPNSINPTSGQMIPVAVLTTDTFDATQVDAS